MIVRVMIRIERWIFMIIWLLKGNGMFLWVELDRNCWDFRDGSDRDGGLLVSYHVGSYVVRWFRRHSIVTGKQIGRAHV